MIAALYVEKSGPYFKMDGVDPWGVDRDARKYTGPHPVIAHPPCGPYSVLRKFYKGEEHDCAPSALATVRKWGGVLEHPRYSKFWRVANLPDPGEGDAWGFTVEVNQVAWGHVARKPTWLYFVNVPRDRVMQTIKTGGTPTHWVAGTHTPGYRGTVPPGIKICSSRMRRLTPPAFAQWLFEMVSLCPTN